MRTAFMISILLFAAAGPSHAEDPLESLNTVQETLSQLAQYRATHSSSHAAALNQSQSPPSVSAVPTQSPVPEPGQQSQEEKGASCCEEPAR
ncbi:hypothetical protein LPW11_15305 [Geomonas sp. RF6]|uniref:hypothetical protein n=1 Tax=Geomonas sp. RF6 TaxID=2897342 RepID=UPI001E61D90D|nr:hypothetical protein [Geomonas sp. RF6]UFS69259.1 hypothetical protein LPW11_15305 [Geomonas sp. RF6]